MVHLNSMCVRRFVLSDQVYDNLSLLLPFL